MIPDKRRERLQWRLASASVIFVSLLIQLFVTYCGLLLTHDSREYLAAATSFNQHCVFTGTDGSPYVFWPPLFPVILSLFSEPEQAMIWVHLILSGVVGVLISRLATQYLTDVKLRIGFVMAWLLGIHQLLISVFLWSELVFLVLLLCFVELVIRSGHSRVSLLLAFTFGALLCLQRNAGLFIVPAASLWLILAATNILRAIVPSVVILLSTAGGIWWNASNMFGSIQSKVSDLDFFSFMLDNVLVVTDGVAHGLLPFTIFSIPIAILIVVSPLLLIWPTRRLSENFALLLLVCWFYLGGMAILFELDHGDADRYAAVILPFLLLFIFKIAENATQRTSKMIRTVVLVGMICWLAYPLLRTAKNALQWHDASCNVQQSKSPR